MTFIDVIASMDYAREAQTELPALRELVTNAKRYVPGAGTIDAARLIFVGEAPGAMEDLHGRPFIGKSGRFLDILLASIGLIREEVWITNVVKFRPPKNRDPYPSEIAAALPYLRREVALVGGESSCRAIVGLGRIACGALAGTPISMARNHGLVRNLAPGWSLFMSYHPSWGLRQPSNAKVMRNDFLRLGEQHGRLWE